MYSYASKREDPEAKHRAGVKLEREALRFAADFLEVWSDFGAAEGVNLATIAELRAVVATMEGLGCPE